MARHTAGGIHLERRLLLQRAGLAAAAAALPLHAGRTWAAPPGSSVDTRLLVVFLRGAYDACSVLVPLDSPFYREARPRIAIAAPGSVPPAATAMAMAMAATSASSPTSAAAVVPPPIPALPFTAAWGLAPAWRDTLWPLAQAGQLAAVPFAGLHDLSRSHFETQDRLEAGLPSAADPPSGLPAASVAAQATSGFLNRLAQVLGVRLDSDTPVMSFTERLPLVLQGARIVPNLALANLGTGGPDERQVALLRRLYAGSPLEARVREGLDVRAEMRREMATEPEMAARDAVPARGFELEATRIARVMREQVRIGFVDVGGWDTHVGQGGATGLLAGRLGELGRGLAAFQAGMGTDWARTVVVVVSEFGRTFRENGNGGTDHGHGTVYWVMGGAVAGGVHGEQMALTPATLNEGRDWPVLNEARGVLGGLFGRLYGLDAAALQAVFPGARPQDLRLV